MAMLPARRDVDAAAGGNPVIGVSARIRRANVDPAHFKSKLNH
jgi:hypothetical protein